MRLLLETWDGKAVYPQSSSLYKNRDKKRVVETEYPPINNCEIKVYCTFNYRGERRKKKTEQKT
jgi:hypothetical protein